MIRDRALKVVLVVVGLLFLIGVYGFIEPAAPAEQMLGSLYATLGIFLLLAVRNPSANRSLIAFTAWSSFAHAVVMSTQGLEIPSERSGFLGGSAVLIVIGAALIVLAPRKQTEQGPVAA